MSRERRAPARHALAIGIDRYPHWPSGNQLRGAVADAELAASVLHDRFGFRDPMLLTDAAASRAGILAALDELVERAGDDDLVVVTYSGHGSQVGDTGDDEPDGLDETIVPADSTPQRRDLDVTDDEIHAWLLAITRLTANVTLVFDSCHSGTIVRDHQGGRIRRLPAGRSPRGAGRGKRRVARGPSGWLPLGERYALFAACRDEEPACEHHLEGGLCHGALTYFLFQELGRAGRGTTFRDVFEKVAPRVTAAHSRQHPQLEGTRDRELFADVVRPPVRFFPVAGWGGGALLEVAAGSALGMSSGSELAVFPPGTKRVDGVPAIARVRVSRVGAVRSLAEVIEGGGEVMAGCRAVETFHDYGEMRLAVAIEATAAETERLSRRIEASARLRLETGGEGWQVRAARVPARSRAGEDDTAPQLGALTAPVWALLGLDGELVAPVVPAAGDDALARVVGHLETRARYLHTLALENPDPGSALADRLELRLRRRRADGAWNEVPSGDDGLHRCREGEVIGFEVTNLSDRPVELGLLSFGLTGRVELLHPVPGSHELLPPGATARIATRPGDPVITAAIPPGLPFAGPGRGSRTGTEFVKLVAATAELDLTPLTQDGFRAHRAGPGSALNRLLRLAATGRRQRRGGPAAPAEPEDWGSVLLALQVEPLRPT